MFAAHFSRTCLVASSLTSSLLPLFHLCSDPALGARVMNHSASQHLAVRRHLPFYRYLFPALGGKYHFFLKKKKKTAWASNVQCMSSLPSATWKKKRTISSSLHHPRDSLLNGRKVFLLRMWTKGQRLWGLLSNPLPAP